MKEKTLFVMPQKGLLVRDPETKNIVPETGMTISTEGRAGKYWKRRLNCGDIFIYVPVKKIKKIKEKKGGIENGDII